ncbi:MAG: signal recognition particle receptor subunit alpha, partial [Pseudomonadota bacterium]
MFDQLTDRLAGAVKALRGQSKITDGNIDESLREVRIALLEADVGVDVVREFLDRVRQKALGQSVVTGLTPGQELIRIVRDELTAFMGEVSAGLDLATTPPVVILMAGLQGSGKTTTTAKLARRLIEKEKKDVALVSCDIHRPAAVEQLAILAAEVGATVLPTPANQSAEKIAKDALAAATKGLKDVLIVDTAGRLAIDAEMMDEIRRIHMNISPHETLFVIDSMMGQDAVQTARSFDQALPLTGVVLTKVDG